MTIIRKLMRRWKLRALDRVDLDALRAVSAKRVVRRFRQVARQVPGYADLLAERGARASDVAELGDFLTVCPVLSKADLFGRVPLQRLCVGGRLDGVDGVLTSSGQGGRFSFGLSTRKQSRRAVAAIELGLQYAFQTDDRRTLLINALPMGVSFSCPTVTVAQTSVREDMVAALVEEFGRYYEQIILVLDPLFCKRLLDYGRDWGLDWSAYRIHAIVGEETFGEQFRSYVARRLGQDPDGWTRGFIGSSMGVGELGLNLFFETRETVALRQLAHRRPEILRPAMGDWPGRVPPMVFVYDPLRIFVEVIDPDALGFGDLVVSTLDSLQVLPLLRYRTGDRARLVDRGGLRSALEAGGAGHLGLPGLPIVAVCGRSGDVLPDGRTLLDLKDALYADVSIADQLSGAFRVGWDGSGCDIQVQARAGWDGDAEGLEERLVRLLCGGSEPSKDRVRVWPAMDFPERPSLDYERKFSYLVS